jgi:hypothetical protein
VKAGRYWYPCEQPERPNDPLIIWHSWGCQLCHNRARMTEAMLIREGVDDDDIQLRLLARIQA